MGVSGAALGNWLYQQGLKRSPLGIPLALASLFAGGKTGAEISDVTSNVLDNELLLLKQERDRIIAIIKTRKEKLNVP